MPVISNLSERSFFKVLYGSHLAVESPLLEL